MIKESGIVERLEPCPFCGATDLTLTRNRHGWKVVECDDCGMKGPCIDLEGDEYLARWNTRPAATLIAELQAENARQSQDLKDRLDAWVLAMQGKLAAESSLHRVSAWQPIETAPKDGCEILLWWVRCKTPSVGYWMDDPDDSFVAKIPGKKRVVEGWVSEGDRCIPVNQKDCTHWMPLPAPPAVADTNADVVDGNGLLHGISSDPSSLNITGLDTGAVKTGAAG